MVRDQLRARVHHWGPLVHRDVLVRDGEIAELGEGLAAPAMAAVVEYAARTADHVSLYVNAYNEPALRTYARVGFEQVGTFATVLY